MSTTTTTTSVESDVVVANLKLPNFPLVFAHETRAKRSSCCQEGKQDLELKKKRKMLQE